MTKKLNESAIFNELKSQSAFFRRPTSPPDEPPTTEAQKASAPLPENLPVSAPEIPVEQTEHQQVTSSPSFPVYTEPVRPYGRTDVRPDVRTPVRRTITRYAFEFFQDQIETLKQFSLDEKGRGEKGSMSEMVREAVDMYISKRRNRDAV
jgi:hypothetical protein